ncbi:MAG: hypothetical protein O2931_16230 [Planctomycetota bacterium]|nr:hypothetical protein [Planctomycetota bacterium]MDA1180330.1 hypothetical protein [Planctomycetota bacterium]
MADSSKKSFRTLVPMFCVLIVVVALITPFFVGLTWYGAPFVEYAEGVCWCAVPVLVAGALAGFVSEFMGVWLTRRLDYGLLVGTGAASAAAFLVVIPPNMSYVVLLSVGGGILALLLLSVILIFAKDPRRAAKRP